MSTESLPTIDFMTLVVSLSQTALVHLGEAIDPESGGGGEGQRSLDLPMARQTIDLLGVLQEKTKGNLTGDEERLLDQVLYDLRLRFVEVAREAAKNEAPEAKGAGAATSKGAKA
jgi:hypothetical protein